MLCNEARRFAITANNKHGLYKRYQCSRIIQVQLLQLTKLIEKTSNDKIRNLLDYYLYTIFSEVRTPCGVRIICKILYSRCASNEPETLNFPWTVSFVFKMPTSRDASLMLRNK